MFCYETAKPVSYTHLDVYKRQGYNDQGREVLEEVYAAAFHTEAALVRPQITCGTHALAIALSANLLPGDELLSPVGRPYDTLEEVIGLRESPCSLAEFGVSYREVAVSYTHLSKESWSAYRRFQQI